jgi:tRNA A-37 threonylcarbamoyl transferase component Bud32
LLSEKPPVTEDRESRIDKRESIGGSTLLTASAQPWSFDPRSSIFDPRFPHLPNRPLPKLVEIVVDGIRWRVAPECRDRLLGPNGFRLQEWLQAGQAVAVKHGPHRTVYRVNLPGLSFYLKHNRVIDFRTWIRQLVRPSKSAMEFERVVAVAGRRIPTVTPLGLGEALHGWRPGDNFLVTHCLENTEPLSHFIEQTLSRFQSVRQVRVRQRLAKEMGEFIARIHDAGILHNDLHAGNILVRLEADDRPQLFLIDLHSVKIGRPLNWSASRANLVILSHWFMIQACRTDRLRFWHTYLSARGNFGGRLATSKSEIRNLAHDLEKRSWRSTLRLWRAREVRYLTRNRAFEPLALGVVRGHIIRDLNYAALQELSADPDAPFRRPDVNVLKDSPSSTVIEFDMPLKGSPCRVVYKRFRVKTWLDPIAAWFRRPAALRSWIFGQGLRESGLPTPQPLAVFFRRRCGLSFEGYLLTEKINNVQELHRFVADLDLLPGPERQKVLRNSIDRVACLVRDLHARRLSHRDLKAANILVRSEVEGQRSEVGVRRSESRGQRAEPGAEGRPATGPESGSRDQEPRVISQGSEVTPFSPTVWLIDLVGVKRHRRLSGRRRVQNLARLHASFFHSSAITRSDKLRFLRTYLQWGLFGRDGWKRYWREIEIATRAKIARNTRLRRPLG